MDSVVGNLSETYEASPRSVAEGRAELASFAANAAVPAGELWILISDDGCGLQPRTERAGLGLGLGLISEVSDDFAIVSRAAGGTEVRIRFNLVTADAPMPEGARAER